MAGGERRDLREAPAVLVGEPLGGVRPGLTEIAAAPDRRAVPLARGGGEDRARARGRRPRGRRASSRRTGRGRSSRAGRRRSRGRSTPCGCRSGRACVTFPPHSDDDVVSMRRTATPILDSRRRPVKHPERTGPLGCDAEPRARPRRAASRASARARSSRSRSTRSFVKRRSLQPDWRVPSSWPSPRSSRSTSASSKPSVVSTSASRRDCATSVSSSLSREISRQ